MGGRVIACVGGGLQVRSVQCLPLAASIVCCCFLLDPHPCGPRRRHPPPCSAVPTIATAWQGVAEAESRRAGDAAVAAYVETFKEEVGGPHCGV